MGRQSLRLAIGDATAVLAGAGVDSARTDAELLAAHLLGVGRGELPMIPLVDATTVADYRGLVARRATRVPLHHITGWAWLDDVGVEVGPGVFTPRPETELLLEWALTELAGRTGGQDADARTAGEGDTGEGDPAPVVLDLCTGSGVLALSLAHAYPAAVVHAVELDPGALVWARRNAERRSGLGDRPVRLHQGDVTDRRLLVDLEAGVDLVVANPPYVPEATVVPVEVREHDPTVAVFAGADGLAVIRPLIYNCAQWLRVGGVVGIEHDESHAEAVAGMFRARTIYGEVTAHDDLAGRPRFTTARRVPRAR